MVRAISLDASGNPIKGTEQEFSDAQWVRLKYAFGDKLRWLEVKSDKQKKKPLKRVSQTRREELKKKAYKETEKTKEVDDEVAEKVAEVVDGLIKYKNEDG